MTAIRLPGVNLFEPNGVANTLLINGSTTGQPIEISTSGEDTDRSIVISPAGNGNLQVSSAASFGGAVTLPGMPTENNHAATKQYVDEAIVAAIGIDLNDYLKKDGGTMTGQIVLAEGTTTMAPVVFPLGSLLAVPVAGALEWNGINLYMTQVPGTVRRAIAYQDSNITGTAANVTGIVAIDHGGTGATTASDARINLGALGKAGDTMTGTLILTAGSASDAPLKFQAGALLDSPAAHALEWDGTNLYVTQSTGPTRKTLAFTDSEFAADQITTGTFNPERLGTGLPSNTTFLRGDGLWTTIELEGYLLKDGDTMTGPLVLADDPVEDLEAATKKYVDSEIATVKSIAESAASLAGDALPITGGVMTGPLTLAGSPTEALHAATKAYVDANATGFIVLEPVRVVATTDITISSPGDTIDGVTLIEGDRILLIGQTDATENGLYEFNGDSSPLTRTDDADEDADFQGGIYVLVLEGNLGAGSSYVLQTLNVELGITPLTFIQFSSPSSYVGGNGISINESQISVKVDNTLGIAFNSGSVALTGQALALHQLSSNGLIARTGSSTVANRTITGTTNRITISDGDGVNGNPTIDIASNYAGQTSITTLGTITSGTWNATAIGVSYGGTGATDAATARSNLGLGSISTQSASSVSISGGTISGTTSWEAEPVAITYGGTGASDAVTARTNLGLGSIATQSASSIDISGGTISGTTVWNGAAIAVAYGGTGATDASGARSNLGLGSIATQAASSVNITGGSISGVSVSGITIDGNTSTIQLKRSDVEDESPAPEDIELGEIFVNTHDGKLFIKKDDGDTESVVEIGGAVSSVAGKTGDVTLDTSDIEGLSDALSGIVATNSANTFTATQTFLGNSTSLAAVFKNAVELVNVVEAAATGTIAFNVLENSIMFYTSNASANWTINIRGDASTTLNSLLSVGQAITVVFMAQQGGTARYNTSVQIDGTTTGVTTRWAPQAPSSGNANSVDVYTYTVIKTNDATWRVFANQTAFGS